MKQKGEFYKVKKSGFSMLLLLICVSMLSVMPVSAARKKSRYDLQFSDLKVNKRRWKQEKNGKSALRVKTKEQGKFNVWLLHIRDRNVRIMMFCWNIKRKVKVGRGILQ